MAAPINPKGAKSDKEWRAAIMLAVNEAKEGDPTGKKKLRLLAEKLVDEALGGNVVAMKEIGDRLDGKPTQPVGGDPDNPIEVIRRVIVGDENPAKPNGKANGHAHHTDA